MNTNESTPDPWKPTKPENPNFRCRKCNSDDIWYKNLDGDYDDTKYECRGCNRRWIAEGADA